MVWNAGNCLTVAHVTLDLGQLGGSLRPFGPSALPILRSGGFFFFFRLVSGFFPFLDGRNPEFVPGFQIARCLVLLGKTCFKQKSRKTIVDWSKPGTTRSQLRSSTRTIPLERICSMANQYQPREYVGVSST